MSSIYNEVVTVWHQFGAETKAALIGAASTFLAAGLGVGGIILQLRSQAKQSRLDIAETERRKLKATMWDEVVADCRVLSDAIIECSSGFSTALAQLKNAAEWASTGQRFPIPTSRAMAVNSLYVAVQDAAVSVVMLIERRQIVDPRILVFRTAFASVLHMLRDTYDRSYFQLLLRALPMDAPKGDTFPYSPPAVAMCERLEELTASLQTRLDELNSYSADFQREMQCLLLGDLFGTELGYREPLDPDAIVVRLDRASELEDYFRTRTEWGRNLSNIENEVRQRFADRTTAKAP